MTPQTVNEVAGNSADTDFAVEVRDLSRVFRGRAALQNVHLQIPKGSIFGLVGLNAAGKTTLIRHLIGAFRAQTGSVRVLGEDPVADPESLLKRIGYLTEEDSLPDWMRVGDVLDFSRAVYPTWDDAYARRLGETFGLSRQARLRSLSKGQRARVGLLAAIAHRPELLLLDEPSSGLDPTARKDILEAIIRTVSEDGRTVLFSSHLLDEVDRVCDSIALMHNGTILETLSTDELHSRYREIICRLDACDGPPPANEDAFGWQAIGREWSAVIRRNENDTIVLPPTLKAEVIQQRDITLERWFAARTQGESNALVEVSADV